jgi:4-hydroxyphenylpyruvate dioxygenase-like putative hemolysin
MSDLFDNPMGLTGFEFVEFASPTPDTLEPVFEKPGFTLVAKHRSKDVVLYRQGDIDFEFIEDVERHPVGHGLKIVDHLTHNVYRGRMTFWANFYEKLFNFRELRYFDIQGEYTGLTSKALTAPVATDLLGDAARAGVLRIHPAQRRRRLRRGQLQGAVPVDRSRPTSPWRVEG